MITESPNRTVRIVLPWTWADVTRATYGDRSPVDPAKVEDDRRHVVPVIGGRIVRKLLAADVVVSLDLPHGARVFSSVRLMREEPKIRSAYVAATKAAPVRQPIAEITEALDDLRRLFDAIEGGRREAARAVPATW